MNNEREQIAYKKLTDYQSMVIETLKKDNSILRGFCEQYKETIRKRNLQIKNLRKEKQKWYGESLRLASKLGRNGITA